ncbi:MAG: RluA family pseudouridine synthase [Candidatus Paceibacterota bacterium]|jgi:23S rRNA pseudouridine1911/1915/1917 synthase
MPKSKGDMPILFEDKDILCILKPTGISVHHDGKTNEETVTDWLIKKYPKIKKVGEPLVLSDGTEVLRPGIVHRLDKETSGALLVAKTQEAYEHLKAQFQERQIRKTYYAFVYGTLREERGMIDKPIGRAIGSIRKWATGTRTRGELRDALTRFKVVGRGEGCSLAEVWPQTGRTHQIRVHMQAIGHPIVADSLYAPTKESVFGFKRLALHASRIVFTDLKGKSQEVLAPFPADFESAIKAIGAKI